MNAWRARGVDGPPKPPRITRSTAVLLPGPFGGLHLYTRRAPGPLRAHDPLIDAQHLVHQLQRLPTPCTVVLCGRRYLTPVAKAVLPAADLYVVSLHWLETLDAADTAGRASLAARLVSAHRRAPIECLWAHPQLRLPF